MLVAMAVIKVLGMGGPMIMLGAIIIFAPGLVIVLMGVAMAVIVIMVVAPAVLCRPSRKRRPRD